jgi:hypothetical protein
LKAVGESRTANRLELDFEAPGGAEFQLPVRFNRPNVRAMGAELAGGKLRIVFPPAAGYERRSVTLSW